MQSAKLALKIQRKLFLLRRSGRPLSLGERLYVWLMTQFVYHRIVERRYAASIAFDADIDPGVEFVHELHGIYIAPGVRIGPHTRIMHNVTIGAHMTPGHTGAPSIGIGVFIGTGVTIIGRTVIGDGVRIGAGISLTDVDIPAGAVIVNSAAYDVANQVPVYPTYKSGKSNVVNLAERQA